MMGQSSGSSACKYVTFSCVLGCRRRRDNERTSLCGDRSAVIRHPSSSQSKSKSETDRPRRIRSNLQPKKHRSFRVCVVIRTVKGGSLQLCPCRWKGSASSSVVGVRLVWFDLVSLRSVLIVMLYVTILAIVQRDPIGRFKHHYDSISGVSNSNKPLNDR
jgi:hypothetical protein